MIISFDSIPACDRLPPIANSHSSIAERNKNGKFVNQTVQQTAQAGMGQTDG